MLLDDQALLVGQRARLRQDRLGDADLPDVMEQRAELEPFQLSAVEAEPAADLECEVGDPARVRRRVLVVRLECVRERLDRLEKRRLQRVKARGVRQRQLRLVRDAREQPQLTVRERPFVGRRNRDAPEPPAVQ